LHYQDNPAGNPPTFLNKKKLPVELIQSLLWKFHVSQPNVGGPMYRFKTFHLLLLLLLFPIGSFAAEAHYCIAVSGGFGHGGTTYVGDGFAVPAKGNCTPWSGYTKTASTVILTTTGTGCLSSGGTVLTVSVINSDPSYFGSDALHSDYIRLTRSGTTGSFGSGSDFGVFGGNAKPVTCSSSLLTLPGTHD
jgi:hypothetical protein